MHKCPFVIKHSLTSKAVGNVINIPSITVAKYEFSILYCACTCKIGCNFQERLDGNQEQSGDCRESLLTIGKDQ